MSTDAATTRCGHVEPWISGWSWIRFADTPEPVKRPHLSYMQCPEDATVSIDHDGITFVWCAYHAAHPICGVPKKERVQ
jgi:hypothetical protein